MVGKMNTFIEFMKFMIKVQSKPVVISTQQSLYKLHRPYFAQYGWYHNDDKLFIQLKS